MDIGHIPISLARGVQQSTADLVILREEIVFNRRLRQNAITVRYFVFVPPVLPGADRVRWRPSCNRLMPSRTRREVLQIRRGS